MLTNKNSLRSKTAIRLNDSDSTEKLKMKPHLLMFAHYYYPDVASTGQILKELAEGMLDSFRITVICVVPSYSGTIKPIYRTKKYYYDKINGVDVIRVRVPEFDKTNKRSRIKNIATYFFRAIWAMLKIKDVDYTYSISQPPILGGMLGVINKWLNQTKFIYNIQDFNPEQVIATGYSKNRLILKAMMGFDKFSCKQSDKVIVVGRDMIETLKKRFRCKDVPSSTFINNWVDEEEIYPLDHSEEHVEAFRKRYGLENKFVFMYSGNLGLYYDLENLIKIMEKFPEGTKTPDGRNVVFAFVGTGSIRDKLYLYSRKNHMSNVIFIPYQDKSDLNYSLNAADVHWCVSAMCIRGVSVPSKLYGIMAAGKPVIGVMEDDSEAGFIIRESMCGLLSVPDDYIHVENHIQWFIENSNMNELRNMGYRGREHLVKELAKAVSVKKYKEEVLSC